MTGPCEWRRAAAICALAALGLVGARPCEAQSAEGWFRDIPAGPDTLDELELVRKHAPDFLQWVNDKREEQHLDFITRINFDEQDDADGNPDAPVRDWNTLDSWENADQLIHDPEHFVYGGLVAVTENQLYLV